TVDSPITFGETLTDVKEEAWRYQQEERIQLQGALSQLDTKTQAAIEFVFIRDLPRYEVAKQIGVSQITVSRYLQRGVNELVSLLQPQTSERLAS
ncbi:MAG: sigma factor-like helix-turn-helix DNA-binding protein, partial [Cyanobacteriota bacterium]